jgi:hypothetical protein
VWSWIANRLVVWRAKGELMLPDKIVAEIFAIDTEFSPVQIGVEQEGLNEWLLQPIRHEQLRQGRSIPVKAVPAPRGKTDFILGLQPYWKAGEIEFVEDSPDAKAQFAGFPKGRIDIPNALAFALKMRPGQPIYEDFSDANVLEAIFPDERKPVWLAVNASGAFTVAVLAQLIEGRLNVLQDWVLEGEAGATVASILREARLEALREPRVVVPPEHFQAFQNIGLVQSLKRIPVEVYQGVSRGGRDELRRMLKTLHRGLPILQIAHAARWTLNAFAGGFARATTKSGLLAEWPVENQYKTLMEGLESLMGLAAVSTDQEDGAMNYAFSRDGRRYATAMRR